MNYYHILPCEQWLFYFTKDDWEGNDDSVVLALTFIGCFAVWTLNTHPMVNLLFIPQSYIIQLYTYEMCAAKMTE